jgi:PilZ domain
MVEIPGSPANKKPAYSPPRTVPRYTLIATAEIADPVSGVRMSGRLSEISRKGCYLDVLNTLPSGTHLKLRVSRDRGTFECDAKIIYAQDGMGMGLLFVDPPPNQLKVLDAWLADLGI